MMLNRDYIIYYGNNGPEPRPESSLFLFYKFDDSDYWYVDFCHGWHLEQAKLDIPIDVVNRMRSNEVTLLLNNSHEAFHDSVDYIYRYFVMDLNIPPKQIKLLTESASITQEVYTVANKLGYDHIKVEWLRMFEYNVNQAPHTKLDTLQLKNYDKKFLNLNRRWRKHRPIFVALLELNDLLQLGHVSLASEVDGERWDRLWDFVYSYQIFTGNDLYKELMDNRERINNIPDLYLDTNELHINQVTVDDKLDKFYLDTYFSIVAETNYFKDLGEGLFLSEKVFKPILKRHPFLVLSRPHTLEKLRMLGYKTFSPYIDESYDTIEDDTLRIKYIINETKRLSNLNEEELKNFLIEMNKIVDHNYELLINKQPIKDNYVTTLIG